MMGSPGEAEYGRMVLFGALIRTDGSPLRSSFGTMEYLMFALLSKSCKSGRNVTHIQMANAACADELAYPIIQSQPSYICIRLRRRGEGGENVVSIIPTTTLFD